MNLNLNLDYHQILKLVQQLPDDKLEKLTKTLQIELQVKKRGSKKSIEKLIQRAPTWSDDQFSLYKEARTSINTSRLR